MPESDAPDPDDRLASLDARVKDALGRREALRRAEEERAARARANRDAGVAWRIMLNLVIATALTGAIGLGIDRWLGSVPFGMIAGSFIGFAVGMWLAVRTAAQMQAAAPPPTAASPARRPDEEED